MNSTDLGGSWGQGASDGGDGKSPREMASAAVQGVRQEAASFAEATGQKASKTIEQKKEVVGHTMTDFANAIRKAGDDLAEHDQTMIGKAARQAADGLESLSRSVIDKRPEEMLEAVRDFGRRNPTAFIAGSLMVGLAVGRFVRSSERHVGSQQQAQSPPPAQTGAGMTGMTSAAGDDGADAEFGFTPDDGGLGESQGVDEALREEFERRTDQAIGGRVGDASGDREI